MKLKSFLDKYNTVIFDLDGVITSESAYWDAAALTVYQEINARNLFDDKVDIAYYMANIKNIRKEVFADDKIIKVLKNRGVNSNWDLSYVTYMIARVLDTKDFKKVLDYAKNMSDDIFKEYGVLADKSEKILNIKDASRSSRFWETLRERFQEWVLGDITFKKIYGYDVSQKGKKGLLAYEKPVVNNEKLKEVIKALFDAGKRLCTATGRNFEEMELPLKNFGIFDYFAKDGLINFNHVMYVEKNLGVQVTKPHPYMFEKALYGNAYSDDKILAGDFDKNLINNTLIIGDAGADILAAKAMGADFCAVLTGVSGEQARSYFESLGSQYILNSILDFEEVAI